ncbi:MMPL family transporter [Nocardioides sp. YIM B13467]|uniref:MMPL family transporter n=1 Tax=Nocardioides sp. YIM B13467 TaxID=3366294 RepID=UPI00366EDCED
MTWGPGLPRGFPRPTRRQVASALLMLLALGLVGLGISRVEVDTKVDSFVPAGDSADRQLRSYQRTFGGDAVVVEMTGTTQLGLVLDPTELVRLIRLEGALAGVPNVHSVYGPGTVLNQTAGSVKGMLAQVAGARDQIRNVAEAKARRQHKSKAEVTAAGDAALVPFDRRYGKLLAEALPVGLPTVQNQKFVASVLMDRAGNPRPEWRFLVPTAKSATLLIRPEPGLDQEQTRRMVAQIRKAVRTSGLSIERPVVSGVPVVVSGVADRAHTEILRLGAVALGAVALVLVLSGWSRRRRHSLLPLGCALLGTATTVAAFGLAGVPLSLGAAAFLPVLLGVGSDFPLYLLQSERVRGVLVTAGAAAAAFASLALTPLPFVREFGLALGLGLVLTVGWALVLRRFGGRIRPRAAASGGAVSRHPRSVWFNGIAAVLAAVAVAGWLLLPGMRIQSSPEELAKGVPELADAARIEQTLGFSGELDIVLRGKNVASPEAIAWSQKAQSLVVREHADQMRPLLTYSQLLAFLGGGATAAQVAAGTEVLPDYLTDAVLASNHEAAVATYGITLDDVSAQRRLIESLRQELPDPPKGYRVEIVGLPVLAAGGLSAMEDARYTVNAVGILVAALAVGLGLRSWRAGVRVLLTALLAAGWLFGVIRLAGIDLSPLTLAIGALVTVTSCEFVTMLSERRLLRSAGRTVLTAAVAGAVGYLALGLSGLTVLRDFGLLLAAGVVSSYAAAQLVARVLRDPEHRTPEPETPEHPSSRELQEASA